MQVALRFFAVLSCLIWLACGDDTTDPDPQLIDVSISGRITDILTDQPINGSTVVVAGESAVTDSDGQYELDYMVRHISEEQQIVISSLGYQTYTTYAEYSIEEGKQSYALISNQRDTLIIGSTVIESFNEIARTSLDKQRDLGVTRWAIGSAPRYIVYPGFDAQTLGFIEDVSRNSIELASDGNVKNATSVDSLTSLTDSIGALSFEHSDRNAARLYLIGNEIVGVRILLRNGINLGVVLHEAAGHGTGREGHYDPRIVNGHTIIPFSVMSAVQPSFLTPGDLRDGKILYRRPIGSEKPDNDPTPSNSTPSLYQSRSDPLSQLRIVELVDTNYLLPRRNN